MRVFLLALFLLVALLRGADAFSAQRPPDNKTKSLSQREHQQVARNGKTGPEAKHHTYREEVPGKHKESAWFQRPAHKPKTDEKKKEKPEGREWTYGKVPRF
jgi:hypothetical protein